MAGIIGNASLNKSGLLSSEIFGTTMPKSYSLGKQKNGIKIISSVKTWTSHIADVVGNCNGVVFRFTIGCYKTSSDFNVNVISQDFNTGSYRLYKDSDNVYLVCINTGGVNDGFIVYSSSTVEKLTGIDTTSMTEVAVSLDSDTTSTTYT